MTGFVRLHRSVWDHPVFRDRIEASAFVWMCSTAAWRDVRVRYKDRIISLKRGQLAISSRDLARDWGWSEAGARRFLDRMKTDAMIDAACDAGVTVITICNYDKYQADVEKLDAPSDAVRDAGPTQDRRTEQRRERREEIDSEPKGSDTGAVSGETLSDEIWSSGLKWLSDHTGKPVAKLRPVLGRWVKLAGEDRVVIVLRRAAREGPVEPISWITAALKETDNAKCHHENKPSFAEQIRANRASTIAALAGELGTCGRRPGGVDAGDLGDSIPASQGPSFSGFG